MKCLILASQSPRRSRILSFIGIKFKRVVPARVIEGRLQGESPVRMVRRLAVEKASSLSSRFSNSLILAADTMVVSRNKIFGKPRNKVEAARMINGFSGRSHFVLTGVALVVGGSRRVYSHVEKTRVFFRKITKAEVHQYLKTNEPYDKAGGYDIQGTAGNWVRRLEGDYFNVMGLPINWVISRVNNQLRNKKLNH